MPSLIFADMPHSDSVRNAQINAPKEMSHDSGLQLIR